MLVLSHPHFVQGTETVNKCPGLPNEGKAAAGSEPARLLPEPTFRITICHERETRDCGDRPLETETHDMNVPG